MSVPDTVRHGAREVIFETYPEVGYNYRMTDIQAAVGREQLKRLPGDRRAAPAAGGALRRAARRRRRRSSLPVEPALGAQQLAELLGHACRRASTSAP